MGLASAILSDQPENQKAQFKQADIYIGLENYFKAIKIYNQAIKLFPNNPQCYYLKAKVYADYLNQFEKAINNY